MIWGPNLAGGRAGGWGQKGVRDFAGLEWEAG